jgi:hypothetical protein
MKRLMLVAFAGVTILAWRMYANDESKTDTATTTTSSSTTTSSNHETNAKPNPMPSTPPTPEPVKANNLPVPSPEPAATKQIIPPVHTSTPPTPPAPVAKPTKLIATPPTHASAPAAPKMPTGPAGANLPPAVNFQMQMAQIHQKVFSGFAQPDLMEFGQALEQALNGALATKEFDKGVSKLEDAARDLAIAFGRNIEVDRDLHLKIKNAFDTATTEFETLIRSGKIADLTGEAYLARILKAVLAGLKIGFAKAEIIPGTTPVSAHLGLAEHDIKAPGMPNEPVGHTPKMQTPVPANLTTKTPSMPERPMAEPKMPTPPVKA